MPDWMSDPLMDIDYNVDEEYQNELIGLQSDDDLKVRLKKSDSFF